MGRRSMEAGLRSVVMLGEECGRRLVGQRGRRASVVWQQGRAHDEVRVTRHLRGGGVEELGRIWKGAQELEAERVRADPREMQQGWDPQEAGVTCPWGGSGWRLQGTNGALHEVEACSWSFGNGEALGDTQ